MFFTNVRVNEGEGAKAAVKAGTVMAIAAAHVEVLKRISLFLSCGYC